MEVNKEEAIRCLHIAQKHRSSKNYPSALKFAKKSISLYSTPEGEAMVTIIQREITISSTSDGNPSDNDAGPSGSSTPGGGVNEGPSTPNGTRGSTAGKSSGVEEHLSEAHKRHTQSNGTSQASGSGSASAAGKEKEKAKRTYTEKQMEVVVRVKKCKHHEYYEILSVEKSCSENDVKKAYKKLALALHPDKNGAPGADEAFKMVSKAFQVLSDDNLRAVYDSNPSHDPTMRGGGGGGGGGMFRGGGMQPGFGGGGNGMYTEINPEDLFNAFFGGGMGGMQGGNVFTFGGPGVFQAQFGGPGMRARRRATGDDTNTQTSPIIALLPILLLVFFAVLSNLSSIFGTPTKPDPSYTFEGTKRFDLNRKTWNWGVDYWVNHDEFTHSELWASVPEERRQMDGEAGKKAALYSNKLRVFERGVENVYVQRLRNECDHFSAVQEQKIQQEAGFFGIGADYEKIRKIRAERSPACDQIKKWGIDRNRGQQMW